MNSEFQSQLDQLEQDISSIDSGKFERMADDIKQEFENRLSAQIFDVHKRLTILYQQKVINGEQFYKKLRQLNEASADLPDKLTVDERFNQHALNSDSLPYFIDKVDYREVTDEFFKYLHGKNTAYYKQTPDGKSAFIIARDSENKVEFLEKTTQAHRIPLDKFIASSTVNPHLIDSEHIVVVCSNSIQRWYKHQRGSWFRDEQIAGDELEGQPRIGLFRILPNGLWLLGVNAQDRNFEVIDPKGDLYEKVVAHDVKINCKVGGMGYADGFIFSGEEGGMMMGAKFPDKKIYRHQYIDGRLDSKEIVTDTKWNVHKIQAISKNEIYIGVVSSWTDESAIQKLTLDDDGNLINRNVLRYLIDSKITDFCVLPNGDHVWTDKVKRVGIDRNEHDHTRVYKWTKKTQTFDQIGDYVGVCHALQVMPDGKIIVNVISPVVGQYAHILDGEVKDE